MLSADSPKTVVIADYQERAIPQMPLMSIDEFTDRWNVTLTAIAKITGLDYTTVMRARNRHRKDGTTINRAIWLSLGYTHLVWTHQQRRAA